MHEAHNSVDREENRKLKQEIAELRAKYEKEALENKIKILEMQNEIQTLKHQMEIAKLKAQQEKTEENVALNEENQALKEEIQALIHRVGILEVTNPSLKEENASNSDSVEQDYKKVKGEVEQKQKPRIQKPLTEIPDRFFKGAEKFLSKENFLDQDYKSWYEDMSRSMENRKQYVNQKFVLIRKDMKRCHNILNFFVLKPEEANFEEDKCDVVMKGFYERLSFDAKVFLLHPNDVKKCLEMECIGEKPLDGYKWWEAEDASKEFYFEESYSVIMLAIFDK